MPDVVPRLRTLAVLDLSRNRLDDLPAGLLKLRGLQVLSVHSNALPPDLDEAAAAGVGSVWAYLEVWHARKSVAYFTN